MAMSRYAAQIDELLEKMFAVKALVLPANRRSVERYLSTSWSLIKELTAGFRRAEWTDTLHAKFSSYVADEEDRMRRRLETIRYDIDAADTLVLVTGPGRIEKVSGLCVDTLRITHWEFQHLFLLLYLLLKRDFEIVRLAQGTVLHKDELWDSANTIEWVFRAVSDRHHDLESEWSSYHFP